MSGQQRIVLWSSALLAMCGVLYTQLIPPFELPTYDGPGTAVRDTKTVWMDGFDATLDPSWHWVRESSADHALREGRLQLRALPGTLWDRRNDAKNILLRPAPKVAGEWAIQARVEHVGRANFEQSGLLVHGDDGHYVKIVKERIANGPKVVLGCELGDAGVSGGRHAVPEAPLTLRLTLTNQGVLGEYASSADGVWHVLGMCPSLPQPSLEVGVFAHGGTADPAWSAFDDFEILSL